jgi:hypothetical protein
MCWRLPDSNKPLRRGCCSISCAGRPSSCTSRLPTSLEINKAGSQQEPLRTLLSIIMHLGSGSPKARLGRPTNPKAIIELHPGNLWCNRSRGTAARIADSISMSVRVESLISRVNYIAINLTSPIQPYPALLRSGTIQHMSCLLAWGARVGV